MFSFEGWKSSLVARAWVNCNFWSKKFSSVFFSSVFVPQNPGSGFNESGSTALLLSYEAPYWATMHSLANAVPWARLHPTELRCTLLSSTANCGTMQQRLSYAFCTVNKYPLFEQFTFWLMKENLDKLSFLPYTECSLKIISRELRLC